MTVYSVYEPSGDASVEARAGRIAFVKEGFSWVALFVPLLWLLYQRMWLELVAYLAIFLSLPLIFGTDPTMKEIAGIVSLGLTLIFAFEANNLRGWAMRRRGFRFAGIASGRDRVEAETRFFTRWLSGQERQRPHGSAAPATAAKVPSVSPTRPAAGDEVIGSFPRG
ncbi:MAG: DUF2628 domain-containing protein [Methyloceanibacter sp.]|uniref:DUF2628 domain-containing protein n=1 Tax=Methyloceanibacter sp. TaxID=1965321 RepID=UPI001E0E086A|nr:DUF2628 domain-containing protein [Methyloceanibacter sp.]MCB1443678.1 DUF2628 domain-containing protein [Methyloceanibacter sp.]MCC0059174.1 DUF2628 domain-containing protein [Hyphomicrobiaceae bacterium]